jgi:hypothetical protein
VVPPQNSMARRPHVSFRRACVKTLESPMVQCIFGHVGSISPDFVDSNRALWNLHGVWYGFAHSLVPQQKALCYRLDQIDWRRVRPLIRERFDMARLPKSGLLGRGVSARRHY